MISGCFNTAFTIFIVDVNVLTKRTALRNYCVDVMQSEPMFGTLMSTSALHHLGVLKGKQML